MKVYVLAVNVLVILAQQVLLISNMSLYTGIIRILVGMGKVYFIENSPPLSCRFSPLKARNANLEAVVSNKVTNRVNIEILKKNSRKNTLFH